MRTIPRVFEVWVGEQRSGKTTALRARVRWLARMRSVTSVWVLDRLREWTPGQLGLTSCVVCRSLADYLKQREEIPRVIIWQLGTDVAAYERVLGEAVYLGRIALVVDEAYEWAPAGATWTGSKTLREIVLAGRHLEDGAGELCETHLLIAAQYPRSMHHLMWSQANVVMVGRFSGENTSRWLAQNFGKPTLARCAALPEFGWCAVRGERPPLSGYGPQG